MRGPVVESGDGVRSEKTLQLAVVSESVGAGRRFDGPSPRQQRLVRSGRRGLGAWPARGTTLQDALTSPRADQLNNLDLEGALASLDDAMVRSSGRGHSPVTQSLAQDATRCEAGIVYSPCHRIAPRTMESCLEAVKPSDYNASSFRSSSASEELHAGLQRSARRQSARPTACHGQFTRLPIGTPNARHRVIEGVSPVHGACPSAARWSPCTGAPSGSEAEFTAGLEMVGVWRGQLGCDRPLRRTDHGGKDIEYFFYIYDGANPSQSAGQLRQPG